jgi:hypothetical protein
MVLNLYISSGFLLLYNRAFNAYRDSFNFYLGTAMKAFLLDL